MILVMQNRLAEINRRHRQTTARDVCEDLAVRSLEFQAHDCYMVI